MSIVLEKLSSQVNTTPIVNIIRNMSDYLGGNFFSCLLTQVIPLPNSRVFDIANC